MGPGPRSLTLAPEQLRISVTLPVSTHATKLDLKLIPARSGALIMIASGPPRALS